MRARFKPLLAAGAVLAFAFGFFAAPARATDDFADAATSVIRYTRVLVAPKVACASLVGRALGAKVVIRTARVYAASATAPAFCDVHGTILPSNLFDVALPLAWNERLYGLGNAGCGDVLADNFSDRNIGLSNGFAVAATDTGIENVSGDCAWAAGNPNLAVDFAYEGIHDTAVVAKQLLQLFYARPAVASYYNGCSDGGHDGLEEAQRFPEDFDGIVAGAPFLGAGTVIAGAWMTQAFASLPAAEAMTSAKVSYIASRVYAACDGLDGLVDGVINDPQTCARTFDPARDLALCAAGTNGANCLTAAQRAAYIKAVGPVLSRGTALYPGQPLGTEIEFMGNEIALAGASRQNTVDYKLSNSYMQYLFPWPKTQPTLFADATFDFDTDPARIDSFREMFDPTHLNMSAFFARGGKLLAYHGLVDPLISAYGTVAFFEDESKLLGASIGSKFAFYPVPGMAHCTGGPGAYQFDPMTKLVNWVEGGRVPGTILARHSDSSGKLQFTRTLCPYPETPTFAGGNTLEASSFRCVAGPTGVPGTAGNDGLQLP